MLYKDFQGLRLSTLGMGTMRLPLLDGTDDTIDETAVHTMVDLAIAGGVNYFDTAWGYHDGQSELVTGRALARYPRESYYLADKFPGYDLANMDKVEEIFEAQLEKTGAGYFDFYLFHNVCEMNIEQYLDPKYGILDYLLRQKANGRIRHLGFSDHSAPAVTRRFLDAYGEHMEFCQIQLNWLDWEFQGAKEKVEMLCERQIPIWVMEPLRGGRLTRLDEQTRAALAALRPEESLPGWGFRFLQSIPEVTVVLSGMSSAEQLRQNLEIFAADKPTSAAERETLFALARTMTAQHTLPCTGCRYCVSHCPQGLDIPWMLELYNEDRFTQEGFIAPMALASLPEEKRPSACLACRSCEAVCPQKIEISAVMAALAKREEDEEA